MRVSIVMENEWPSHEQLRLVLVHFPAKFLHESTIIHSSDTSSTWDSVCYDDSLVIISRDHLLGLRLSSSIFFKRGTCSFSLVGLWFRLPLKVPNPRLINSDNSSQECLIFNVESFIQQVAMSRRFCFYSGSEETIAHYFFLFFKSLIKIRKTDVAGTPVALESSSHVARRSSSKASGRCFTLLLSVDVLMLHGLGSLSVLIQPPR